MIIPLSPSGIPVNVSGGSGDVGVVDVVGRAASSGLRALIGSANQCVIARGYNVPGDNGGGLFQWVEANAANNDGTVIVPGIDFGANTAGYHWKRVYSGALNVQWFGASGDYVPDAGTGGLYDDAGFQRAADALSAGEGFATSRYTLLVPDGIYKITSTFVMRSNWSLRGDGRPILWGIGVDSVVSLGFSTPVPTIVYNSELLDISILGSGNACVDAYATESCFVKVFVGGAYTYGVKSIYIDPLGGGVAYNSRFGVYVFSYQVSVHPFTAPGPVDTGVHIEGAWTGTKLDFDFYQSATGVNYRRIDIAGLGQILLSGIIQGATTVGIRLDTVSTVHVSDVYFEGNALDVDLANCYGVIVDSQAGNVKARNSRGLVIRGAYRVDADRSNVGVRVDGYLSTGVSPSACLITDSIGVTGDFWADEVARRDLHVSPTTPVDGVNLVLNGDFRRWDGANLWGRLAASTMVFTKCGIGLADTTHTNGSPYSAKCTFDPFNGGGAGIKLCGPLPSSYLNTQLTVTLKCKPVAGNMLSWVNSLNKTLDDQVNSINIAPAGQPHMIPADNGFFYTRYSVLVTQDMVDFGAYVAFLCYSDSENYLSEVQASFGDSAPRGYLNDSRTSDNSLIASGSGPVEFSSATKPVTSVDSFYGAPWLAGDYCRNLSSGYVLGWRYDGSAWVAVTALDTAPRPVAASDALTEADNGRTIVSTAAGAITLTIPDGLPIGFACSVFQQGAGQVTLAGSSLQSLNGLKTSAQYATVNVRNVGVNVYSVSGNVTP